LFHCFIMCLCCLPSLRDIFPTTMARYSLFVLKVPLNTKQIKKQTPVVEGRQRATSRWQRPLATDLNVLIVFTHETHHASAVFAVGICPSVRLSHAGIVSKRLNYLKTFGPSGSAIILVFNPLRRYLIPRVTP